MRAYACTYTRVRSVAILGHFLYILSHFERLTLNFRIAHLEGCQFWAHFGAKIKRKEQIYWVDKNC